MLLPGDDDNKRQSFSTTWVDYYAPTNLELLMRVKDFALIIWAWRRRC